MSDRTWVAPLSSIVLAAAAAWLTVSATIPAVRARAAAGQKHAQLLARKDGIEREIEALRAESKALRADYQYNRRLQRWLYRGGPEPGD